MALKWRFSGGILFSSALHVFLLSALVYWYPGIISKNGWQWDEWSPFFANEPTSSGVPGLTNQQYGRKASSGMLILTFLTPVTLQNALPEKKSLNLNAVELKEYHQQLKGLLSERWEVPIHLIESQFTAEIQFEITKNGRLLSWSMEESANSTLNKSVKNLLKNLQFLPSLPESYPEDSYKFGVRFTPANFQL